MTFALSTATILSLVVSVIIPLVSSLLAKAKWPAELVGLLTLAIAAVNGFATQWALNPHDYDWKAALGATVVSFLIAVASRYGLWKDTATDSFLLNVGSGSGFPDPQDNSLLDVGAHIPNAAAASELADPTVIPPNGS